MLKVDQLASPSQEWAGAISFCADCTRPVVLHNAVVDSDKRKKTPASHVLRAIAGLDYPSAHNFYSVRVSTTEPHLQEPSQFGPEPARIQNWRASVIYVNLDNHGPPPMVSPNTTVIKTAICILSLAANRGRVETGTVVLQKLGHLFSILGVRSEKLHTSWDMLDCKSEIPVIKIALALLLAPAAILLDGSISSKKSVFVGRKLKELKLPFVWAGCSPRLARRLNAAVIHVSYCARTAMKITFGDEPSSSSPLLTSRSASSAFQVSSADREMARKFWAMAGDLKRPLKLITTLLILLSSIILCVWVSRSNTTQRGMLWTLRQDVASNKPISIVQIGICSLLVFFALFISWKIGVGKSFNVGLLVAAARCAIQLHILGFILVPIFDQNKWWMVFGYLCIMVLVAAQEATRRTRYVFKGMYVQLLAVLSVVLAVVCGFGLIFVLQVGFRALEALPIGGMILNSCLSATSLALTNVTTTLAEQKENIEMLLSLGATRMEATQDILRRSVVLGLTPMSSLMATTGIVSISGMMTGQLLAGAPPLTACRYQIIVMYLLCGSSCCATIAGAIVGIMAGTDAEHRIRTERLLKRENHDNDVLRNVISSIRASLRRWRISQSEFT